MSDSNRADAPAGDSAPATDFESGVDAISDALGPVLDGPDPDEDEEQSKTEADDAEDATEDDASDDLDDADADEADEADADESDDDEAAEDDEDSPDAGFADDDLKVTMADGRTITVAELRSHADKRIKDMQRHFTERTQETSERAKKVEEAAQTLSQHRDFLVQWMEALTPQPPDPALMEYDFVGYMQAKDYYDRSSAAMQHMRQQAQWDIERQQKEQQQAFADRIKERDERFKEMVPAMQKAENVKRFADDINSIGREAYGITAQEVNQSVTDPRQFQILMDALEYRKLQAKAPKARKAVEGKPKMMRGSKRADPKSKASAARKSRADNLRKTGSIDAGVAALMDLDL